MDRRVQILRLRRRSLFRGRALDRELEEELQDHLARQAEENRSPGFAATGLFSIVEHGAASIQPADALRPD